MVAPLIGAAARMAAKKLAEKEAKRQAQIEAAKESVKEGAKKTAKAAGATGAVGVTYIVGESMSPSGSGPAIDAISKMQRESRSNSPKQEKRMGYDTRTNQQRLEDAEREENRGMKKGGAVKESKMMKKEGRGMAKAEMQKVAGTAVKGHEKRMHKMAGGGSVSARADGIAVKGKTKGRIV
jgi:hypothetical protein